MAWFRGSHTSPGTPRGAPRLGGVSGRHHRAAQPLRRERSRGAAAAVGECGGGGHGQPREPAADDRLRAAGGL